MTVMISTDGRTTTSTDVRTLWYTRCPVPTATGIAISGGWLDREFAPDQIAVRSLGQSREPELRLAHDTHAHPALLREGGIVPPLWASATTGGNRLIGLATVDQFHGLLTLRGSQIADSGDLCGARIALPAGAGQPADFARAAARQGIETAVATAGLTICDVTLVEVRSREALLGPGPGVPGASLYPARENVRLYTAEVLALIRGQVDAIYAAGPHALAAAAMIDAVPVAASRTGAHLRILTVSTQLQEDRPDLVDRYVSGLLRASRWAAAHTSEAWSVVAAEVGVAEEWARAGYCDDLVQNLQPRISEHLLDALQDRAGFLHDRGFLPRRVDVRTWLDADPLQHALALQRHQHGRSAPNPG
jgi:ABC-type nitrate/sulfonate/bicarbonate transport system substrate-binding protein